MKSAQQTHLLVIFREVVLIRDCSFYRKTPPIGEVEDGSEVGLSYCCISLQCILVFDTVFLMKACLGSLGPVAQNKCI